jgi:hypothetical protein
MNPALNAMRTLAPIALMVSLGGCTALSLASRGAPQEQMRAFAVELSPVDLDAHGPSEVDHVPIRHDHRAPDHDVEEHRAYLEQQRAMRADPAMPAVHHGVHASPLGVAFPEDGWVHGFDYEVVDENGRRLPSEVLHHLQVLVPNRRELFSPVMLRVAGAGGETQATEVPREVGYRISAGDSLIFTAMLHNPTGQPLGAARVRVRLRYSPQSSDWREPAGVVPFFTHVTGLMQEPAYDLPPGPSERSALVRPATSGTVLAMGGHLHRYGVSLRIEDAVTRKTLWETHAVRATDGTVLEVPDEILVWNGSFELEAGRDYRVVAVYDNPTGRTVPEGGMGTLGGIIRPSGAWPEADRNHGVYLWDAARLLQ